MSLVDLGKKLLEAARAGQDDEVRILMANGAPFTTDWVMDILICLCHLLFVVSPCFSFFFLLETSYIFFITSKIYINLFLRFPELESAV